MIQWTTIGKPLLMTDAALIISFIIAIQKNSPRFLFQFLFVGILSLAFKLSSLLVFFPLLVGLIVYLLLLPEFRNSIRLKYSNIAGILLFSTIAMSVLLFRFIHTANPFYPFLSDKFTPDRFDYVAFAEYLKSYRRDENLWVISLFVPTSFRYIASVLGPIIPVAIYLFFNQTIKTRRNKIFAITFAGIMFSLLAFSQARADYYFAPTMLLIAFWNSDKIFRVNKYFRYAVFLQICYTVLLFSFNLFQSIDVVRNPIHNLGKYAYGYNESKVAVGLPEPTLYLGFRQTRLYFAGDYIDSDRFKYDLQKNGSVEAAIELLGIKSIVATANEINNLRIDTLAGWYIDAPIVINQVSRNPFNKEKIELYRCYSEK